MDSIRPTPLLFTLGSNPSLAKEVSNLLNLPLSPAKVSHFADGEVFAKPLCEVTNHDIFIIHSTFRPVSERLMDLLVFVDALYNAGAHRISVIFPYYGYSRQDRIIDPGDPISGLLVAKMLQAAGVNEILTIDFHSLPLLARFPMEHENITAAPLFADHFATLIKEKNVATSTICVVSPDHGGLSRAQHFASYFSGSTFAYALKSRPEPNKAQIESIVGDVSGKLCIIIDDMIDTAGTLSEVVKTLVEKGATEVWVAATHGIFSGMAPTLIKDSPLTHLLATNTIESTSIGTIAKEEVVSVAPLIVNWISEQLKK